MTSPPWYSDGLRFACTQCGRCCTVPGFVWVEHQEMEEIAELLGMPFHEFTRTYVRRVGRRYSLIEKATRECVFWQGTGPERGCQIYSARPSQCRTFPFWDENLASERAWDKAAKESPGVGQGRLYEATEIERLATGEGETGQLPVENTED